MTVRIIGTKHNVECTECGRQWGVYLDENNNLPDGWDVCLKCLSKIVNKKENVNYGIRIDAEGNKILTR